MVIAGLDSKAPAFEQIIKEVRTDEGFVGGIAFKTPAPRDDADQHSARRQQCLEAVEELADLSQIKVFEDVIAHGIFELLALQRGKLANVVQADIEAVASATVRQGFIRIHPEHGLLSFSRIIQKLARATAQIDYCIRRIEPPKKFWIKKPAKIQAAPGKIFILQVIGIPTMFKKLRISQGSLKEGATSKPTLKL